MSLRDTWCWRGKRLALVGLALCGLTPIAGLAQVGRNNFPADPSNLYDWRAARENPALGAFQSGALEVGFKIFHLGFVDNNASLFKSAFVVLNLPRRLPLGLALGVQTQMFSTPLFRENELTLSISRHFFGVFSLGFSAGVLGLAYNQENFKLVDPNDPLFAQGTSVWQPELGAGLTIIPARAFILGLGVKHLNKPDVALGEARLRLDPTLTLGLSVNLGGLGIFSGGRRREANSRMRGFLQVQSETAGMLQFGYDDDQAWLRGRLHVAGPVSVGYGYTYPVGDIRGESDGSHEASVVYEFDRLRRVPKAGTPPLDWTPFQPDMAKIDVVPQYAALASHEAVDIFTKRLIREIATDLDSAALARLTPVDLGVLDSSLVEQVFPFEHEQLAALDTTVTLHSQYSTRYLGSLADLRRDAMAEGAETVIVAPETQVQRAMEIGSYFLRGGSADRPRVKITRPARQGKAETTRTDRLKNGVENIAELTIVNPPAVIFTIFRIHSDLPLPGWELVVENEAGTAVFTATGRNAVRNEISWDWQDGNGRIIAPGFYNYYVAWRTADGRRVQSRMRQIYARKLLRNIRVKITRTYQKPAGGVDKIGVILNK